MRAMIVWMMAAVVAFLVAGPSAHAQQRVDLKTGVESGRTLRFDVARIIEVGQRAGEGEESVVEVSVSVRLETSVVRAEDDGSGAATAKILRYEFRVEEPDGPTSMTFDLTGEPPAVTSGLMAFDAVLRSTRLAYDVTASGRVENLSGLDAIMAFAVGAENAPPHMFDFFQPAALRHTLSMLTDPAGGIGTRGVAEEWTSERRVPFGRAGAFDLETRSAVRLAQAGFAAIASVTEFELLAPTNRDAGTPIVTLEASNGQALINWDTDKGGARQHSSSQLLVTGWTVGQLTLTQRQESRTNITRLD
jgi:hypothetical protein